MANRSEEAAALLRSNAIDFLNGGISLLFDPAATARHAKIGVISIQTAVELFAKYRIVRELGLEAIVRKGVSPKGGDLLKAAALGHFSTLGFDVCLEKIGDLEWLGEWQRELVSEVQKTRNTLVHFAGDLEVDDTRRTVAALLVQVLALFAAGRDRDYPEMQTHRQFLDAKNFDDLTAYTEFIVEAFDAATGDPDAEEIFRCWECARETLTRRQAQAYFCWTCGLTAQVDVAGFAPCWQCLESNSVVFDSLNEVNGAHFGRCIVCGETAYVTDCTWCGERRSKATPALLQACRCHD